MNLQWGGRVQHGLSWRGLEGWNSGWVCGEQVGWRGGWVLFICWNFELRLRYGDGAVCSRGLRAGCDTYLGRCWILEGSVVSRAAIRCGAGVMPGD